MVTSLSPRQRLTAARRQKFVRAYLLSLDVVEATRAAGYNADETVLWAAGQSFLEDPEVQAEVETFMKASAMPVAEVLMRVSRQARGSMSDFLTIDPTTGEPSLDFQKAQSRGRLDLVKKYSETTTTSTDRNGTVTTRKQSNVELYDSAAALDKLMRYHSLYKDRLEISWTDEIRILLLERKISFRDLIDEVGEEFATKLVDAMNIPMYQLVDGEASSSDA